MAESLQDLHEYEGGVIVHSDVDVEQWLLAPDKTLKLNDFNNAYVTQWDRKKKAYCYRYSEFGGIYRAPEEYEGEAQDETKDTFSLGNNIYTILTGLFPFYDEEFNSISHDTTEEEIVDGKRPYVDDRYRNRSYIESMLVKIMEACWAGSRHDRPSMSFVVDFLQNVKYQAWKRGELEPSDQIKITMPEEKQFGGGHYNSSDQLSVLNFHK
jgi:serine/threonine protein kinase